MNRRQLLALGGAALLCTRGARLIAAPESGPRFLLVFLRGGYDSTNLLVPYSSSFYYEARPNIAIARPQAADRFRRARAGCGLGARPRRARFDRRACTSGARRPSSPFAGTDDLSRSHFETQDSIELGQPTGGASDYRSGFLGRLAGTLSGARSPHRRSPSPTRCRWLSRAAAQMPNLSLKKRRQAAHSTIGRAGY